MRSVASKAKPSSVIVSSSAGREVAKATAGQAPDAKTAGASETKKKKREKSGKKGTMSIWTMMVAAL